MGDKYRDVSEAEFTDFVTSYPRELHRDVLRICDPARVQFNDFTRGDWPASIVADYGLDRDTGAPYNWRLRDI